MKAIATVLLFITGIIMLAWIAQPLWGVVGTLRADEASVSSALSGLSKTKDIQQDLIAAYRSLSDEQLQSLLVDHLPDNSSTGPLLVAIERLAKDNTVIVTSIEFKEQPKQMQDSLIRAPVQQGAGQQAAVAPSSAQELKFSLSVTGTYDHFKAFLSSMEHYIRIVDIDDISFASSATGDYSFTISAKTYYRK